MNKSNVFSFILGLSGGSLIGNQICKRNHELLMNNKKIQVAIPESKDDVLERVPKALSAAAKELVDHRTIEVRSSESSSAKK